MQIRLYNALAVSVMLYRREAWSSTRAKGQMLQILEIKCMKRIKEYTKDDRIKNATTVCELKVETLEEKVYRHKKTRMVVNRITRILRYYKSVGVPCSGVSRI